MGKNESTTINSAANENVEYGLQALTTLHNDLKKYCDRVNSLFPNPFPFIFTSAHRKRVAKKLYELVNSLMKKEESIESIEKYINNSSNHIAETGFLPIKSNLHTIINNFKNSYNNFKNSYEIEKKLLTDLQTKENQIKNQETTIISQKEGITKLEKEIEELTRENKKLEEENNGKAELIITLQQRNDIITGEINIRTREEHKKAIAKLTQEHAEAITELKKEHAKAITELQKEHAEAIEKLKEKNKEITGCHQRLQDDLLNKYTLNDDIKGPHAAYIMKLLSQIGGLKQTNQNWREKLTESAEEIEDLKSQIASLQESRLLGVIKIQKETIVKNNVEIDQLRSAIGKFQNFCGWLVKLFNITVKSAQSDEFFSFYNKNKEKESFSVEDLDLLKKEMVKVAPFTEDSNPELSVAKVPASQTSISLVSLNKIFSLSLFSTKEAVLRWDTDTKLDKGDSVEMREIQPSNQ